MQSPKHALALQNEFKGLLYTPKVPINCTSGHYITYKKNWVRGLGARMLPGGSRALAGNQC